MFKFKEHFSLFMYGLMCFSQVSPAFGQLLLQLILPLTSFDYGEVM